MTLAKALSSRGRERRPRRHPQPRRQVFEARIGKTLTAVRQTRITVAEDTFEAASDVVVEGRPELQALLRDQPSLSTARSQREHHATLLDYVAANGVEQYRHVIADGMQDVTSNYRLHLRQIHGLALTSFEEAIGVAQRAHEASDRAAIHSGAAADADVQIG
jgi:hypothetical protein